MLKNYHLWQTYFPQFAACPDKSVKSLMESAMLVDIPDGEKLFYPGKHCSNYLLLLEGAVKAQLLAENGREIVLYYVRPGDSCVLTTSCLLGEDNYPAEGVSEGPVKAFVISAQAFHRCLDHSAFFREFVFRNFSARLSNVIGRMETVLFAGIEQRLADTLLAAGSEIVQKTHQELAAELGSAREEVSRHLKRFESYGWVKLGRGTVEIVDRPALSRLAKQP
ncbi:Crp/Fnr family transcriptional regulator [Methylomarinum vadi]|uniref:Crp/Fnr family transcriptional regulator n=1 Tax=Methylomarinum vadi TaxID=438855 RepID=UPI000564589D|nr:Crp/Fnr family transcriptional regulator [Methylomarinum vadi]